MALPAKEKTVYIRLGVERISPTSQKRPRIERESQRFETLFG